MWTQDNEITDEYGECRPWAPGRHRHCTTGSHDSTTLEAADAYPDPKTLATVLTAGLILGLSACGAGPAAQHNDGPVAQAFQNAASESGVPLDVLMGIGWVESRWTMQVPEAGAPTQPRWGIMGLGEGGSLNEAAAITGDSQNLLERDVAGNISGAAAILAEYAQQTLGDGWQAKTDPADWRDVIAQYSGYDPDVAAAYADDVLQTIQQGAGATLDDGESLELPGTDPGAASDTTGTGTGSGALSQALSGDDPTVYQFLPADPSNYTRGRNCKISKVVIHDIEGSYYGAISWFRNPRSNVSAHYVIRDKDGQITQMVHERDKAWHATVANCYAIGIEHEGYAFRTGYYTEAMYRASAKLVCHITQRYGIPIDRTHIIGHYQVPTSTHRDPGPHWNWSHYMDLVRQDCGKGGSGGSTGGGSGGSGGCRRRLQRRLQRRLRRRHRPDAGHRLRRPQLEPPPLRRQGHRGRAHRLHRRQRLLQREAPRRDLHRQRLGQRLPDRPRQPAAARRREHLGLGGPQARRPAHPRLPHRRGLPLAQRRQPDLRRPGDPLRRQEHHHRRQRPLPLRGDPGHLHRDRLQVRLRLRLRHPPGPGQPDRVGGGRAPQEDRHRLGHRQGRGLRVPQPLAADLRGPGDPRQRRHGDHRLRRLLRVQGGPGQLAGDRRGLGLQDRVPAAAGGRRGRGVELGGAHPCPGRPDRDPHRRHL